MLIFVKSFDEMDFSPNQIKGMCRVIWHFIFNIKQDFLKLIEKNDCPYIPTPKIERCVMNLKFVCTSPCSELMKCSGLYC